MNISEYIPYGHDNAVTGREICLQTGISTRKCRDMISKAMKGGEVIINLQDGKGYFKPLASESSLVDRYLRQEDSRAKNNFAKLKSVRSWNPNQLSIEEDINENN